MLRPPGKSMLYSRSDMCIRGCLLRRSFRTRRWSVGAISSWPLFSWNFASHLVDVFGPRKSGRCGGRPSPLSEGRRGGRSPLPYLRFCRPLPVWRRWPSRSGLGSVPATHPATQRGLRRLTTSAAPFPGYGASYPSQSLEIRSALLTWPTPALQIALDSLRSDVSVGLLAAGPHARGWVLRSSAASSWPSGSGASPRIRSSHR